MSGHMVLLMLAVRDVLVPAFASVTIEAHIDDWPEDEACNVHLRGRLPYAGHPRLAD